MAKAATAETPEVLNDTPRTPSETISMSTTDLAKLIAQMNEAAEKRAEIMAEKLAQAMLESRQPYEDPKKAENEEKFRANSRKQDENRRKAILATQSICLHLAGQLGDIPDPAQRTSIVWHASDIGEVVGICTHCQRIFRETDPDYPQWRSKRSFNKMSRGGADRWIPDREAAKRVR